MGCDIHMVIERNVGGKWIADLDCQAEVDEKRNYDRFALLAGVRGEGPEPRGIPPDISESAKLWIEEWGPDGHSHSWLPVKDAAKIFLDTDREPGEYAAAYPYSKYFGIESEDTNCIDNYRLVFFFDN